MMGKQVRGLAIAMFSTGVKAVGGKNGDGKNHSVAV